MSVVPEYAFYVLNLSVFCSTGGQTLSWYLLANHITLSRYLLTNHNCAQLADLTEYRLGDCRVVIAEMDTITRVWFLLRIIIVLF